MSVEGVGRKAPLPLVPRIGKFSFLHVLVQEGSHEGSRSITVYGGSKERRESLRVRGILVCFWDLEVPSRRRPNKDHAEEEKKIKIMQRRERY